MRVLDLFSGIGGFSLGLERAGMETVAFCEYEEFPRRVLAKHWPDVPCYPDVRELTKEQLDSDGISPIDLVCGGYPCQPFSHAGKRAGEADDRHLWPEMYRLIETIRPRWVLAENVAGHITMGLDAVLSDLEAANYAWWTFVIPACAVDARHRRDRVWIVAHASDDVHAGKLDGGRNQISPGRSQGRNQREGKAPHGQRVWAEPGASSKAATNTCGLGRKGRGDGCRISAREDEQSPRRSSRGTLQSDAVADPIGGEQSQRRPTRRMGREKQVSWHEIGEITSEPLVRRGTHGIPNRMDRLKALGNAVVPQVVEVIGRAIMETEQRRAA